jgi:hypothetical protein
MDCFLNARTEAMKKVCFCLFLLTSSFVAAGPWTYLPDHEIYPLLDRNGVIHYLQAEMARTQGKGSWEILVTGRWIDASNIEPIRSNDDCDCNR